MKKRLMLCNVVIILAGFLVAFLTATLLVQKQYKNEITKRLDVTLAVISNQRGSENTEGPQALAERTGKNFADAGQDIRISILDKSGNILGDSKKLQAGKELKENHYDRAEIKEAREKGRGYDTRFSASMKVPFYYAAVRVSDGYIRAALPMAELNDAIRRIWMDAVCAMLVGIVLVCFITIVFVCRVTEPINRMSEAAKRIAAGDFTSRVQGNFKYEFLELADSFNSMVDNTETAVSMLKTKQDQLEGVLQGMGDGVLAVDDRNRLIFLNQSARSMLGMQSLAAGRKLEGSMLIQKLAGFMRSAALNGQEIHEMVSSLPEEKQYMVYAAPMDGQKRKAALMVLSDVTRVRKLEQLRSEFVANVTHELKTPLTSIRGSIELLKSTNRDEETRQYFYDVLDIEAERLHHLIDDMLVLSQIENAKDDPTMRPCSVKEALESCMKRVRLAAEKNGITLCVKAEESLFVACTPMRMQQLFGNLIDNAVKYNVPNGCVTAQVQKQGQTVVIKIRDTGMGIETEHFSRLFERFYRVDTSRSREIGGTGLGLSIVKHLVQLYGGEVGVESEMGKGTTFTVCLPLAQKSK